VTAPAIETRGLRFRYQAGDPLVFDGLDLAVPRGSRVVLLGANGVGKTTLLRLLGGMHMVSPDAVRVLGRSAFHDTSLAAEIALLGGRFAFDVDMAVAEILANRPSAHAARRAELMALLEVDPAWRMHRVSDGQRRRVQILLDLETPRQVLLLDEVTADLDVLARADLLRFLTSESETRGTTIVYASHILEALDVWATHLLFLSPRDRRQGFLPADVRTFAPIAEVAALRDRSLHALAEAWMREDRGR